MGPTPTYVLRWRRSILDPRVGFLKEKYDVPEDIGRIEASLELEEDMRAGLVNHPCPKFYDDPDKLRSSRSCMRQTGPRRTTVLLALIRELCFRDELRLVAGTTSEHLVLRKHCSLREEDQKRSAEYRRMIAEEVNPERAALLRLEHWETGMEIQSQRSTSFPCREWKMAEDFLYTLRRRSD